MKRDILTVKISEYLGCAINTASLYMMFLEKPYALDAVMDEDNVDGIEFLLSKCLISEYDDERSGGKKVFFSIDPQYSLAAVLLDEAWKRDSDLHSLNVLKDRTDIIDLHQKYLLWEEISAEVQNLYKRQLPYIKEIIIIVKGQERMASSIAEQIADVRNNIYAMISPPQLMGEIVWQTVQEKMQAGIVYNRITDFAEIVRHGIEIARLEVENYHEELYIYRKSALPEKFYVLDQQRVIFFEKSKNKKKYIKKIQIVKNAGIAMQFLGRYNKMLEECVNFKTLIPLIVNYRKKILCTINNILDKEMTEWLLDIFDYGVFYSKGKYKSDFIESAVIKCKEEGLIHILDDGEIVVNYSIDDILTRR